MTQLVAIVHPLTGKTYHMHPDIAAQKHHWVHPDPTVPTPPESLPLFDMAEVDRVVVHLQARLTLPIPTHHAPVPATALENGVSHA